MSQDVLIFRLDGHKFGVKTVEIQEIIPFEAITPIPRSPPYIAGVMDFRGTLLTVLDTAKRLFQIGNPDPETQGYILIAIIESWPVGLIVSNIEGIVHSEIMDLAKDLQSAKLLKKVKETFCEGLIKWTIDKTENSCILLNLEAITSPFIT